MILACCGRRQVWLYALMANGSVARATVEEAARRVYRVHFALGLLDDLADQVARKGREKQRKKKRVREREGESEKGSEQTSGRECAPVVNPSFTPFLSLAQS